MLDLAHPRPVPSNPHYLRVTAVFFRRERLQDGLRGMQRNLVLVGGPGKNQAPEPIQPTTTATNSTKPSTPRSRRG
jgi:hypothetical protein